MYYFRSAKFHFLISYLVLSTLLLGTFGILGKKIVLHQSEKNITKKMYHEAESIVDTKLTMIKDYSSAIDEIRIYLSNTKKVTGTQYWLVQPDGTILIDTKEGSGIEQKNVRNYDPNFLIMQTVTGKQPLGLVSQKMISVIYPITNELQTKGYLVAMTPYQNVEERLSGLSQSLAVCFVLLFIFIACAFLYLHHKTIHPLNQMTIAATEYANGHLNYPMIDIAGLEQENLAAAIRYLAEKMQSVNEYQSKFIANVSHDFRSPLTSIKGYAQAMSDGTIPQQLQGKYFQIMLMEIDRLTKLTNNLLELNQLGDNGIALEIGTFDINQMVKLSAETFEPQCYKKKLKIELYFEEKESLVDADPHKIRRVLQNLLDNAIKFSNPESKIEIHVQVKQHKVFVSVKDYGSGINKEELSKIWDRFYKSDASRGRNKTGTGLGLSITKEMIEAHNENINVISTPGVGTEFIFSLPLHIKTKR